MENKINAEKSQAIFFTRKISPRNFPNSNLTVNGLIMLDIWKYFWIKP